jgi:hypothetical protein
MDVKRIGFLLLFIAALIVAGLAGNANDNLMAANGGFTLTVDTDKQSYDRSETVSVTGALLEGAETPVSDVSIGLVLLKDGAAVAFGQTITGYAGQYLWQFSTSALEPGTYTIAATANVARAETSFTLKEETTPEGYILTIQTDRLIYSPARAVEVSGALLENNEVQNPVPDVAIGLALYLGSKPVAFKQPTTDAKGAFAWTIPAETLEPGDYMVYATANVTGAEAAFKVSTGATGRPEIEIYKPAANAVGVATDAQISATFNMDVTAHDLTGVKIDNDGKELTGVSAKLSGRVLEISHPVLKAGTVYRVSIPGGAVKGETDLLNEGAGWIFETKSSNGSGDSGGDNNDCGSP